MDWDRYRNMWIGWYNKYSDYLNYIFLMDAYSWDERDAYTSVKMYVGICDWVDRDMEFISHKFDLYNHGFIKFCAFMEIFMGNVWFNGKFRYRQVTHQPEYYNHIYWYVKKCEQLSYTVKLGARNIIFLCTYLVHTQIYI